MSRSVFDQLIAQAPPSRVDVEHIMMRERRRRGRRMWGSAGCAVLVSLAVGVAALLPNLWRPGGGPGAVGSSATVAPATTPAGRYPVLLGEEPTESPDVAAARLGAAMRETVDRAVPGARLRPLPEPVGEPFTLRADVRPLRVGPDRDVDLPEHSFFGGAFIEVNGVDGGIHIQVGRILSGQELDCAGQPPEHECVVWSAPGGGRVLELSSLSTSDQEGKGTRWLHYSAVVHKPDGQMVSVQVYRNGNGAKPGQPLLEPPLTRQQVLAVAMDASLTLYP